MGLEYRVSSVVLGKVDDANMIVPSEACRSSDKQEERVILPHAMVIDLVDNQRLLTSFWELTMISRFHV